MGLADADAQVNGARNQADRVPFLFKREELERGGAGRGVTFGVCDEDM
jgi:hypothetical protein